MPLSDFRALAIFAPGGENMFLPLDIGLPQSPWLVKKIEGLGPTDFGLNLQDAVFAGRTFLGSKPVGRRIEITMELQPWAVPNQTVATLKQYLYRFNSSSLYVPQLRVYLLSNFRRADGAVQLSNIYKYDPSEALATTYGFTAAIEQDEFSKNPTWILKIDCESPYFAAINAIRQSFPKFQFQIENEGTVPVSMYLDAKAAYTLASPVYMRSFTPESALYLAQAEVKNFGIFKSLAAGDRVKIDTTFENRRATVTPDGGSPSTLLAYLNNPDWFVLTLGTNSFFVDESVPGSENRLIDVHTEYRPLYLGV